MNIGFEMKSLILLLFLGAVVLTLAENPFQDEAAQKYLDEEKGENIAELAEADSGNLRPRNLVRSPSLSSFLTRLLGCGELT